MKTGFREGYYLNINEKETLAIRDALVAVLNDISTTSAIPI
ncbi:hypothetical protein [Psychromonas ingrahamii]|nr:hypothetical protein [Psychromonas ingrahamii]